MFTGKDRYGKGHTPLCDSKPSPTDTASDSDQLSPSRPDNGGNKRADHILIFKRGKENSEDSFQDL